MTMNLLELSDYALPAIGSGYGLSGCDFSLGSGDVCLVESDNPDDAHTFLRGLASLEHPLKGSYKLKGQKRNIGKYGEMLCCKRLIGYVAPDAALISNLSIRQNLLLQRYYYENDLDIDLDDDVLQQCEKFGIMDKLDKRPANMNSMEIQAAIIIRELSKRPELLLLNQPEDFIGHVKFDLIVEIFNQLIADKMPVVFLTYDRRLMRRFANMKVLISHGFVTTEVIKPSPDNI